MDLGDVSKADLLPVCGEALGAWLIFLMALVVLVLCLE